MQARPWEHQQLPLPPSSQPMEDQSDGDDEESDLPPAQFFESARAMLEGVSQRALYAAWDKSRGMGAPDGEIRIEAAIGFLFDEPDVASSPQQAGPGPAPRPPPFLPPASPQQPPLAPAHTAPRDRGEQPPPRPVARLPARLPPPPLRRPTPPPVASGSGNANRSPLKQVTLSIDLSDSSEADDLQIEQPAARRPAKGVGKGKGKGRMEAMMVEILSDAEDTSDGDVLIEKNVKPEIQPEVKPALAPKKESGNTTEEDDALDTILAIIPDVIPAHVLSLLRQPLYSGKAELVLEQLFSDEGKYPKVEKGGASKGKKRERDEEEDDSSSGRNYLENKGRAGMGRAYEDAALHQLYADFPAVSQANVGNVFKANSSFYAPTFVALEEALLKTDAERGWKLMAQSSRRRGKGKGREVVCFELETEKMWLSKTLPAIKEEKVKAAEAERRAQEEIDSGAFFECGCCFGDTGLSMLVMCAAGCQFCVECFTNLVGSQIGLRKFELPCMSTDGCTSLFPESEAVKFLPPKTMAALRKITQEKEVDGADIDGLAKCPRCPFACIIENEHERLLHCQNEDCGAVTCRQCQKDDHLPKTCKEVDEDAKVDSIHRIEEAMSSALIRRCPAPKCGEPYVKEDGCNKIMCPSCRTLSCYICGKIVAGYSHFKNAGSNGVSEAGAVCALWDDSASRNFQEIEAARVAAAAEVAKENPGIGDEELKKLDLPAPPPPPAHIAHLPPPVVHHYHHYHHQVPGAAGAGQLHVNVNLGGAARAQEDQAALQRAEEARRLAQAALVDAQRAAAAQQRMRAAAAAADLQRQRETAARVAVIQQRGDERARAAREERRRSDAAREKKRARLLKK